MIYITEDKPLKISGRSSIFILSEYSKDLVDILKSLELSVWHKKESLWVIPVTSLAEIIDKLTYLDDIKLTTKGLDLANIVWEEFI